MKNKLLLTVIPAMVLSTHFASHDALAQSTDKNTEESVEVIVITGTRILGRSVADSPSPVDVIPTAEFINQAGGDMSDLITKLVPSYYVRATGDAASLVRPASLRGLPSDNTLLMVNGKRRHRAAVISFIGAGLSDGAQGSDVSTIPSSAIKQLEVLRDGAAAQYGSDAIAGVLNFILKNEAEGGSLETKVGSTYEGDGEFYQLAGNIGLPLTSDGFINTSVEYRQVKPISRSVQTGNAAALIAAGNTAVADPAQPWGSQEVSKDLKVFFNMGVDFGANKEWYAFGNYGDRRVETGFSFRNPNTRGGVFGSSLNLAGAAVDANGDSIPFMVDENNSTIPRDQIVGADGNIRSDLADQPWTRRYDRIVADLTPGGLSGNCPQTDDNNLGGLDIYDAVGLATVTADPNCFVFNEMFSGGFTPRFGSNLNDTSLITGLRGTLGNGLFWDISGGIGRNKAEFYINNTINASMGPNSPTSFNPGAYIQTEQNINVDLSYAIDGEIKQNIAGGFEWHNEQFEVVEGEATSWQPGPLVGQGFSIGSNGFSGFGPNVIGKWSRANIAFYTDYEVQLSSDLLLGAALRWENFDSFGSTTNYKLSSRWSITNHIALRATHSTGFRAPTPGQANISNITTLLSDGVLIDRGTIPPTNNIAMLYGGKELTPEESKNYTLGVLFNVDDITLSIDSYQIDMSNRITQSADIALTAEEAQNLEDLGFTGAAGLRSFRFYINDFETTTRGIDLVANYPFKVSAGISAFTLTYNYNTTEVTHFNAVTLNEVRIRQIEESLPAHRGNVSWQHEQDTWRTLLRVNYFGKYWIAHVGDVNLAFEPSSEFTLDAEVAYRFGRGNQFTVIAGAENLLNNFPDKNPYALITGSKYPENSPMGLSGGIYYIRLRYDF